MNAKLSPMISEFETDEHAANYDRWFREQVLKAMNSAKPLLSHEQAMARVQAQLEERRIARERHSMD